MSPFTEVVLPSAACFKSCPSKETVFDCSNCRKKKETDRLTRLRANLLGKPKSPNSKRKKKRGFSFPYLKCLPVSLRLTRRSKILFSQTATQKPNPKKTLKKPNQKKNKPQTPKPPLFLHILPPALHRAHPKGPASFFAAAILRRRSAASGDRGDEGQTKDQTKHQQKHFFKRKMFFCQKNDVPRIKKHQQKTTNLFCATSVSFVVMGFGSKPPMAWQAVKSKKECTQKLTFFRSKIISHLECHKGQSVLAPRSIPSYCNLHIVKVVNMVSWCLLGTSDCIDSFPLTASRLIPCNNLKS